MRSPVCPQFLPRHWSGADTDTLSYAWKLCFLLQTNTLGSVLDKCPGFAKGAFVLRDAQFEGSD